VDWAGPRRFRLVSHFWVDDAGVEKTLKAFADVLSFGFAQDENHVP